MRTYIIALLLNLFGILSVNASPIVKIEATIYWYGGYGIYKIVVPYKKKREMFIANPLKHVKWISDYKIFLSERPIPKQIKDSTVWNGLIEMINSPKEEFRITEKDIANLDSLLCNKDIEKDFSDLLIKDMASKLKKERGEVLMNILEHFSEECSPFELKFYLEDNSIIELKQKRDYYGYPWQLTFSGKKYEISNDFVLTFLSRLRFEKEMPLLTICDLLYDVCTKLLNQDVEEKDNLLNLYQK